MDNFNYELIRTKNLGHIWSFKTSENGKIALIGCGDDEGQLVQFNLEEKSIDYYWTEGSYTLSIIILSNSEAIIGTNNGFVLFINLENKEIIRKNQISNKSIKDLKLSNDNKMMYAITSNEILIFDINTLEPINIKKLDFNPWDIVVIPNQKSITIGGSNNQLELLNSVSLETLDSVTCGAKNRDMSSLMYDITNLLLISGTESGTLDMWNLSENKLIKENQLNIEDNIYWLEQTDEYIAFATSNKGILIYSFKEEKIYTVPNASREGRFSLKTINGDSYLLYQINNGALSLSNLTKRNIDFHQLKTTPKFMNLTSNGDIIGVVSDGIVLSNFMNKNKHNETRYDFNSKEKNIAVEKFIFNETDETVALRCEDKSLKVIYLKEKEISEVDFLQKDIFANIEDFYDGFILMTDYQNIYIIDTLLGDVKIIENKEVVSIKNAKIININSYGVINNSDYMATPIIEQYFKIYDFGGDERYSKKLDDIFSSMFTSNNTLVTTSMHNPSNIINTTTDEVKEFDTGFIFDESSDTLLMDECKYCLRISITTDGDVSYQMSCYDLSILDSNKQAKMIWQIEDPILSSFTPLGYCKINEYFYIIDTVSGEMISIDKKNGNIIKIYKLQEGIEDIKISNSGKYIAWRLSTGEFSYISYPFLSCEVSDE